MGYALVRVNLCVYACTGMFLPCVRCVVSWFSCARCLGARGKWGFGADIRILVRHERGVQHDSRTRGMELREQWVVKATRVFAFRPLVVLVGRRADRSDEPRGWLSFLRYL